MATATAPREIVEEMVRVRYRAAKLTTRQFANEANPSIVNHRRIERIMESIRELAVLAADEVRDEDEPQLDTLESEILTYIDQAVIDFATKIETERRMRAIAGR